MSALRVSESVFTVDGHEIVSVQFFTAEGIDCGHIEVPIRDWSAFIDEAAKPWPFAILDRDRCACGHEAHVENGACLAAVYADGETSTTSYCSCGDPDFGHAPVIEMRRRTHRDTDVTADASVAASRAVSL